MRNHWKFDFLCAGIKLFNTLEGLIHICTLKWLHHYVPWVRIHRKSYIYEWLGLSVTTFGWVHILLTNFFTIENFLTNFFFQNRKTNSIVPLKFYLRKLYSFWDIQLLVPKNGQNLNFFCDISNFHLTLDCNNFLMSRPILTNLYLIYS